MEFYKQSFPETQWNIHYNAKNCKENLMVVAYNKLTIICNTSNQAMLSSLITEQTICFSKQDDINDD